MSFGRISSADLCRSGDWRATYHLSPAAWLGRRIGTWPPLGLRARCLDGWRVSSNPAAAGYDPCIAQTPVYRLRHVEPMALRTEPEHWQPPAVTDRPFCIQPGDVLVRRVGAVAAAPVAERHRRHPADGNLGILRGLSPPAALWAAWCINQPHYRDYLEGEATVSGLVRVGLRRLAEMPLAPVPAELATVSEAWRGAQNRETAALERLAGLRAEVAAWAGQHCADALGPDQPPPAHPIAVTAGRPGPARPAAKPRARWFAPADLGDQLNMDLCEQRAAARALVGRGFGLPLSALARINPKAPRAAEPARCRVLRIKDLDHQLGVAGPLPGRNETAWRSQTRAVTVDDVLLSTFAAEPKVAYIDAPAAVAAAAQAQAPGDGCVLPSELVLTLCFHRWPGAYALVLESPPVLAQWRRLATGGGLRFVQPAEAAALALPLPEPEQATAWQERLTDLLAERRAARGTLQALADQLHWLYRASHPERSAQPEGPTA